MKNNRNPFYKVIYKTLLYAWRAAPIVLSSLLILSTMYGVLQVLEIYALQVLFDSVVSFVNNDVSFSEMSITIGVVALISLSIILVDGSQYLVAGHLYRRTGGMLQSIFHRKAAKITLIDYEKSETFDTIQKASSGSLEAPSACSGALQLITYYIPFFIFTAVYLYYVKPLLVLVILLVFVPVLVSELIRASSLYELEGNVAGLKRKMKYYEDCIVSQEYFKETRTKGSFGFFYDKFTSSIEEYNGKLWRNERKLAFYNSLLGLINIIGYVGVLILLVYFSLQGSITVGMFASVFYSVVKLNNVSKQLISEFGTTINDVLLGSYLYDFLDRKEEYDQNVQIDFRRDIKLESLSFQYPGMSYKSLDNINLSLGSGETVAIVGENGSGKTTLMKIITGLYKPTNGSISIGKQTLSNEASGYVPRPISAVFQAFQRYKMSLRENISISDYSGPVDTQSVIERAGIKLKEKDLPQGINTMLSREFGGVELSGGQWQRIAIARGFYREHDLIVLDEPTAAIDPLEEARLYEKFAKAVEGKTAVIITHRLGTARIADKIVCMKSGKIVEIGSHEQLLQQKGYYYHLFRQQAQWYERNRVQA